MSAKSGEVQIYSCYEAGASGYWLHRELERVGVKNLVVVPKAMGQGGKRQKSDRRDSAELADGLDCYLRGKDKALSVVAVPSVEEEEKRALIRIIAQSWPIEVAMKRAVKACYVLKASKWAENGGRPRAGKNSMVKAGSKSG